LRRLESKSKSKVNFSSNKKLPSGVAPGEYRIPISKGVIHTWENHHVVTLGGEFKNKQITKS
jgi:hypothetical protein